MQALKEHVSWYPRKIIENRSIAPRFFRNVKVEKHNIVLVTVRSRGGAALKAGDIIGRANNPRPSSKGRFAREQRVR